MRENWYIINDLSYNRELHRQPLTLEEAMVEVAFGGSVWVDGGKSYADFPPDKEQAKRLSKRIYKDAMTAVCAEQAGGKALAPACD